MHIDALLHETFCNDRAQVRRRIYESKRNFREYGVYEPDPRLTTITSISDGSVIEFEECEEDTDEGD